MSWWMSRLNKVEGRYEELGRLLSDPEVVSKQDKLRKFAKEHSDLTPIVNAYRNHRGLESQLVEVEAMLREEKDDEVLSMIREEKSTLQSRMAGLEEELQALLLPQDPMDDKNTIVEVRAGTGGDEASLFVGDLVRMYTRYAERKGWKWEFLSTSPTELGGYKDATLLIKGEKVYRYLKFDGGIHRVQRVPETESSGRIHTSAVSVVVMPEADEVEVQVKAEELRIDTFRATGSGGQHVNTTDSAIRVTHIPTGLVVSCQDEKSQHKNKAKALKVLQARILDMMQQEQHDLISADRKSQIGSGDRSERIRTYNFPQGRVTDHRINLTIYKLDDVMVGKLDEVIIPLLSHYQAEALKTLQ